MEIIASEYDGKSGVYCIENMRNGKKYIGSSKNILQRLYSHRSYLRSNIHANQKLQNGWNKYGEKAFRCYIVEICPFIKLLEREQFYIDSLSPWYNITHEVQELHMSEESKIKMSKSRLDGFRRGSIKLYQEKPIYQYSLDGVYINSFKSIKEASLKTGIARSSINRFLEGKYKKGGNYLWSLTKKDSLPPYQKRVYNNSFNNKPILVHDVINGVVKKYDSLTIFSKLINKNVNCIRHAMKNGYPYAKRYMIIRDCRSYE